MPILTVLKSSKIPHEFSVYISYMSQGKISNYTLFSDTFVLKSKSDMLTPTWQMDLFIYEYFILIPIYIFILLGILITRNRHKTFQSPYYTMMVSQVIFCFSIKLKIQIFQSFPESYSLKKFLNFICLEHSRIFFVVFFQNFQNFP